jgi:hypothetical protein
MMEEYGNDCEDDCYRSADYNKPHDLALATQLEYKPDVKIVWYFNVVMFFGRNRYLEIGIEEATEKESWLLGYRSSKTILAPACLLMEDEF